ncbi:Thiol-disulfide interchange protein, contains DsbC and DsbD domains [Poseidonocella sedimentorum]|uniref:Thiol-disulfide interchange protein, contains DsbC and DsbD domains n=2 Tax=Poseidonocella sedimentorum TaxID=871652 RepID=A0A1I6EBM0_9RHOB|nr:Thiol-disulfide interchange protein, contains DsbC and DsbD domains [Poseidonocella sedimentorum]
MRALLPGLAALAAALAAPATAQDLSGAARLELLPGWRTAGGQHHAALLIDLGPGWKTYWRAPGDGGIPPLLTIDRPEGAVTAHWPTPRVFRQAGLRSVGYTSDVVVPLTLEAGAEDVQLTGRLDLGICKDVCLPARLEFSGRLAAGQTRPDPRIALALADQPLSGEEAELAAHHCALRPSETGLTLTATLSLPSAGAPEEAVVETGDPGVWVSEPMTTREGRTLTITSELERFTGGAFALDRSRLRITVLGANHAVEITGCPAG